VPGESHGSANHVGNLGCVGEDVKSLHEKIVHILKGSVVR
jgi:hypothetical protein